MLVLESRPPVFVVSATFKEKKTNWSILTKHFSLYIYSEKNSEKESLRRFVINLYSTLPFHSHSRQQEQQLDKVNPTVSLVLLSVSITYVVSYESCPPWDMCLKKGFLLLIRCRVLTVFILIMTLIKMCIKCLWQEMLI